jgi:hypothetical protein
MLRRDRLAEGNPITSKKAGPVESKPELKPGMRDLGGATPVATGAHKVAIHKLETGGYHTVHHHSAGSEGKTHQSWDEARSHAHEAFQEEEMPGSGEPGGEHEDHEPAHMVELHKIEGGGYHTVSHHATGGHTGEHEDIAAAMKHIEDCLHAGGEDLREGAEVAEELEAGEGNNPTNSIMGEMA